MFARPSLLSTIPCFIDRHPEELAFRLEAFAAEVPSDPQASRYGVAAECPLSLHKTAEVHEAEPASLNIAPALELDAFESALAADGEGELGPLAHHREAGVCV
jgi:hypothetical protein